MIATDYMKNHGEQLRAFIDRPLHVLGTDGYGRSDAREALRGFFEVDRRYIVVAALRQLADSGELEMSVVSKALKKLAINADKIDPLYA